jgi:UDP-2-acetamido-3-amino-2,3-dideoxy-glucuronate N-acetyltransferase
MSRHGHRLTSPDHKGIMVCPESGYRYQESGNVLRCLDLEEDAALPTEMTKGTKSYRELKREVKEEGKYASSVARS